MSPQHYRPLTGITWIVLALICQGCLGYRLGPTGGQEAGLKTVRVPPFKNLTEQPRLAPALNTALRQQIQRDGTFALETQELPDVILTGELTHYDRTGFSFNPRDTLTTRDAEVFIRAHVVATERLTGRILHDQSVQGRSIIRIGQDITSSERQVLPLLADDLARQITDLLVEGDF